MLHFYHCQTIASTSVFFAVPRFHRYIGMLLALFLSLSELAQDHVWVEAFNEGSTTQVRDMVYDNNGNLYITGLFWSTVDLDPGAGSAMYTSLGYSDIFIMKLDTNGNHVWSKQFGSSNVDEGRTLTVDASGNVIFGGVFYHTIDFDPGAGVYNLTSNVYRCLCVQARCQRQFYVGACMGSRSGRCCKSHCG